jgi:hypothetical protein
MFGPAKKGGLAILSGVLLELRRRSSFSDVLFGV